MDKVAAPKTPVLESARLLRELHALMVHGKAESEEADAIRDQMERPWYGMTSQEQERMRGLSADLYALAEGGPPRAAMSAQELHAWQMEARKLKDRFDHGDVDALLTLLRKPMPDRIPAAVVHFLQARCWEKLGDHDIAAIFMKAAQKHDAQLKDDEDKQIKLLTSVIAA